MTLENKGGQPDVSALEAGESSPDLELSEPNPTLTRLGGLWAKMIDMFTEQIDGESTQSRWSTPQDRK